MGFDRAFGNTNVACNDLVELALQQAPQHGQLALAELAGQGVAVGLADQAGLQGLRWQVNAVGQHQLNGLLGHRHIGALRNEAAGTGLNGLRDQVGIIFPGDHDDGRVRKSGSFDSGRPALNVRQMQIQQHQIKRAFAHGQGVKQAADLFDRSLGRQPTMRLPAISEQRVVIDQQDGQIRAHARSGALTGKFAVAPVIAVASPGLTCISCTNADEIVHVVRFSPVLRKCDDWRYGSG